MSAAPVTPGPWFFEAETGRIVSEDGTSIAFAAAANESSLRNGPLLAAAPTLLEEVRKSAFTFAEMAAAFDLFGFPVAAEACRVAERSNRALIAKVTGAPK